ncbi:Leucine-rich repeat-containing protein 38 [Cricetulus griseus]|uniref:Leucine-rich repeat-containing protein 38 n=1 Tax=Cricetulus griseus TaxID=10029 RepID=G3IN47_CRIGR|nr:Leucine-rich repeat-containing protein 38 [Cricetulus griseus]
MGLPLSASSVFNLESLQVLELNDNNLRSLNVATLDALPALRTVRLDGNPWLCDCDFAHLFSWIQENASKLPKGEPEGGWKPGLDGEGKELAESSTGLDIFGVSLWGLSSKSPE